MCTVTKVLPTELWRSILRYATHVPVLLDTEWHYDPDERIWEGWPTVDQPSPMNVEELRRAKCSIVLVCQLWEQLGGEFLYEAIHVPSDEHRAAWLVDVIKQSVSDSYRGHGWWTKRIDWAYQGDSDSPQSFNTFLSLLELLPNLQIVSVSDWEAPPEVQTRLVEFLESRPSQSLRRFELLCNDRSGEQLTEVAGHHIPNLPLTSLSLIIGRTIGDIPNHSRLDTISTLSLHFGTYISVFLKGLYFPRLKNLALNNFRHLDISSLVPFIALHKSTLIHLHLRPADFHYDIALLMSAAPHVRSLTFLDANLFRLGMMVIKGDGGIPRLSSISHLGILQFFPGNYLGPLSREIVENIVGAEVFPHLKVVRLLREVKLIEFPSWGEAYAVFHRRGIRMETWEGHAMHIPV